MKVSLTGTLDGLKRSEAVKMIEAVGAEYSKGVTYETNYVVATRLDSAKAVKAREIGVEVITQSEFEDFIEQGSFPVNDLPERRKLNRESNFPIFVWQDLPLEKQDVRIVEYIDADGVITQRRLRFYAFAEHHSASGTTRWYFSASDEDGDGKRKTFRQDRFVKNPI